MSHHDEDLFEERSLDDYLSTFRRRKNFVAITAVTIVVAAFLAATFWPPTFRSTATILIEEPEVPDSLVRATVSNNDSDKLRSIQERVMTTQNLMGVIDKYNLYPKERNTVPANVLADRIRGGTQLSLVSASQSNGTSSTIAFTVSYLDRDPVRAQQINNEIVTLYLSENARSRQQQAQGTVGFLSSEGQQLADQVRKLAAQLADFKTKNAGMLPEELPVNLQLLDRSEQGLSQILTAIDASRQRQAFLQTQLSQTDPNSPVAMPNGQPVLSGESLRLQYLALRGKFGENHPAVIQARHQMEAMGVDPTAIVSRTALEQRRAVLEDQLASAQKKLGENNPQVRDLGHELEAVKEQLKSLPPDKVKGVAGATNPTYIQIQSQLAAETINMQALTAQEVALQKRISELTDQIAKSPSVERDYTELKRGYDTAVAQYQNIASKQMDAQLGESLESERKGEKFSVIEPPDLPISPVSPKRKLIMAAGTFFAVFLSLGGALILDAISGRIYGTRRLSRTFGHSPIIVVPDLERRGRDRRRNLLSRARPALAGLRLKTKFFKPKGKRVRRS